LQITVLGKSPSWQDVDGACSGYLVEQDTTAIVLDCGNGVFGKLRRYHDYCAVDAVVVSHLHADHFLDLVPFAYALTHTPRRQRVGVAGREAADEPARPQLHVPKGARETFHRVVGAWGNEDLIESAFDLCEYDADTVVQVAALRVSFGVVPHYLATHAVEIAADGGRARLTFGADCGPSEALVEFARDTDLLIAEATLPEPERHGARGHLTPGEAGDHGRRARARRLVLTHISDELDQGRARREAEREFNAPVEVAYEGAVYNV
jgi:ribonuclease BN (tRNA processing enzyme)